MQYKKKLFLIYITISYLLLLNAYASEILINEHINNDINHKWDIYAKYINYDYKTYNYKLIGNVCIKNQFIKIKANFIFFNTKTMISKACGNVAINIKKNFLACNYLEFDLKKETASLHHGAIFFKKKHLYIVGNKIKKTKTNTYAINKGFITTCGLKKTTWFLTGKNIKLKKGLHGSIHNAILKIKNTPILYLPYLLFPTTNRQSGLLTPKLTYKSQNGFSFHQSLFLVINKNSDATIHTTYKGKKGTLIGLEYRYAFNKKTKGLIMVDWIENKTTTNKPKRISPYWFRIKCNHKLPINFILKLDMDITNNKKYISNFKEEYFSYNKSKEKFINFIQRSLLPCNNEIRKNQIHISNNWPNFIFNTSLKWKNTSSKHKIFNLNNQSQITLITHIESNKHKIKNSSLYIKTTCDHLYLHNNHHNNIHKIYAESKLYFPYKINNCIHLAVSTSFYQIMWKINNHNHLNLNKTTTLNNYKINLNINSKFSKTFKPSTFKTKLIKHSIKMHINYEYTPNTNIITNLDTFSLTNPKKIITYSITNYITSKSKKTSINQKTTNFKKITNIKDKQYNYEQFCEFKFQHSLKIYKNYSQSKIYSKLKINLGKNFKFYSELTCNPQNYRFLTLNSELKIKNKYNYEFSIGYFYNKNKSKYILTTTSIQLTNNLILKGKYKHNLLNNIDIAKSIDFIYKTKCWSIHIGYINKQNNHDFTISINLSGIKNFHENNNKDYNKIIKTNVF